MKAAILMALALLTFTGMQDVSAERELLEERRLSLRDQIALYRDVSAHDIVWGHEAEDLRRVGLIDPPFFTPDPERVEVVELFTYTTQEMGRQGAGRYSTSTWRRSRSLTHAWRESLPDAVDVHRMPMGNEGARKHPLASQWPRHQNVFFAAQRLGIEAEKVHDVLAKLIGRNAFALRTRRGVDRAAAALGVDAEALAQARMDPVVAARMRLASRLNSASWTADIAQVGKGWRPLLSPMLVINGKYSVSASAIGDVAKTYRIANRLIRQELDRGRAHDGPTDDEEFTQWMAPRTGEVFQRVYFGRPLEFKGVYSHARRELWSLDENGAVERTYRLVGEGEDAYFKVVGRDSSGGSVNHSRRYGHQWRTGLQYRSFQGEDGSPRRYGAFLLTDWLSAPETHRVELPFKGQSGEIALLFSADGQVEARTDKGSLSGSWWLEAGRLKVSLDELGIQSWRWQRVAAYVGFEAPQHSLTPWRDEAAMSQKRLRPEAGDSR